MLTDFQKDEKEYTVLFTCANPDVYEEVLDNLRQYFAQDEVVEIFNIRLCDSSENSVDLKKKGGGVKANCGKYSYGPLCNLCDDKSNLLHLVEEIGAFSSFAHGATDINTSVFILGCAEYKRLFSRCTAQNGYT